MHGTKIRVLLVGPGLITIPPMGWGAIESVIWNIARELRRREHEVDILNERDFDPWQYADYDVIHIHWARHALAFAAAKIPYLYTSHSHLWQSGGEQAAIKNSAGLLSLTPEMLMGHRGVVVWNGVDTEFFTPNFEKRMGNRIICVGRQSKRKNFIAVANAMRFLPNSELVVVGPKDNQTAALACCPSVQVFDDIPKSQLVDYYNGCDICIHPANAEAFALVPLEAMACGLPTIVSPDIWAPIGATVLDDLEPYTIAQAVWQVRTELIPNSLRARALACKHYAWPVIVDSIESAYRDYMEEKP